tara:strand:+ start:29572 stop:32844 length:3273 start_codon:yes stop_codon:yes gene_type:complete
MQGTLQIIRMIGRFTIYTFVLITVLTDTLFAERGLSQSVKSVKEAKMNVTIQDQVLTEALRVIEAHSDYHFVYKDSDIKRNNKVPISVKAENETIESILLEIAQKARVSFRQVNDRISVRSAEMIDESKEVEIVIDEQTNVAGTITDETGEALPGATIQQKGTLNGTITDVDGKFSLNVPQDGTLTVSFVGYRTQEILVNGRSIIDVQLSVDAGQLEEVVVVGYGSMKKSDLTGSVVSVKSDKISLTPATHIGQALQGLVAGINITQNGNTASGQSQSIQIRGRNSITASNSPLIILDGIIFSGGLSEINQNDVESIEVLKDASAAAIYGSRGANGVILITTKKGEQGKPRFGYDGYAGVVQMANVPEVMNGEEFYQFKLARVGAAQFTESELEMYSNGNSTDWIDEATRLGYQSQHNLYVTGGSGATTYYIGGTILNVKGIAKNDNFTKFTGRINVEQKLSSWLTFGTNTQFAFFDDSGSPASFSDAFRMNPLSNPYNEDGSLAIFPWADDPFFSNPLSNTRALDNDKTKSLFTNNYLKVDFPFIQGLSYKLNTGYRLSTNNKGLFYGSETYQGYLNNGVAEVSNREIVDYTIENIVDYKRSFGKHSLFFTGLYSFQEYTNDYFETYSRGFPNEALTYYQAHVANFILPTSAYSRRAYLSQMGRFQYNYDGKYLITATVRRDGYSGFGENNKFGVFPSVALGWNIGHESFVSGLSWLSDLKLRLSIGENGNQAIDPYQTLSELSVDYYLTGNNGDATAVGYYPSKLDFNNLSWETSKTRNLGIDYNFFEGRIQGSIDLYYTNTYDLLLNRTISPVNGVTSITQNIGETLNKGIEFQISTINIGQSNFIWSTDFNIAHNHNEILDLYGNGLDDEGNGWFIGKPISVNYAYVFDGIWQVGDDIAGSAQNSAQPGDIKVKDANGDLIIDGNDREIIGTPVPKVIGGIQNTLKYRNLTFGFYFQFSQGNTKVNPLLDTDVVMIDTRRNTIKHEYWTEENPINSYPENRETTNPYLVKFYEDASFLRVKDIFLSYSLPESILENIGFSSISVYADVKNAMTFTKWSGLDPEFSSGQQWGQPLTRTYLLGLKFSF